MNLPLHPAIVHFPIPLFITAFIMQALHVWRPYWICRTTSIWLLGMAVLTSFGAMLSGQREAIKSGEEGHELAVLESIKNHELIATVTTWGSLVIFLLWLYLFIKYMEDTRIDNLALAFLGLLSLSVIVTSYLGGTLVYIHSLGIR